jgi:glycosyltransferase involved in cell wall biosynthesis
MPKVSIVTPSLNSCSTIVRTLQCIREQSYPDIEHFVIDGGSTDETASVVGRFEPRSRYVLAPGLNQAAAVNLGIGMAQGEVIGWLNADDYYLDREVVAKAVAALTQNPSVGLVYGDFVIVDEGCRVTSIYRAPEFSASRLSRYTYIAQPTIFVRKNVAALEALREDLEFVLDSDWMIRLARHAPFRRVPRFQAAFRQHSASKIHILGAALYRKEDRELRRTSANEKGRLARAALRASDRVVQLRSRLLGELAGRALRTGQGK